MYSGCLLLHACPSTCACACSTHVPHFALTALSLVALTAASLPTHLSPPSPHEQETVTVDLYIIRKLGLMLKNFPQVGGAGRLQPR